MNELAVCAGIGGISLGLRRAGFRTACYVERNPYRVEVLRARIRDGYLDDAPIWDDVTTFDGKPWHGCIHMLSAGFPCQPFSWSGLQRGKQDKQYLWPEIFRTICDVGPQYILLENVPDLLTLDRGTIFGSILADLARIGFDAEWESIFASSFGAPHPRARVFIVAYPHQSGREAILRSYLASGKEACAGWPTNHMDTPGDYIQAIEERLREPSVFGSNDGTPYRVERLEAVGETVIPAIAKYIGRCIMAAYTESEGVA